MMELYPEIRYLSDQFEKQLKKQIGSRVSEMGGDNVSHYLIYQALGISQTEGEAIDIYQNKGRFLYKYAGSLLEGAARMCFTHKYPDSAMMKVPNTFGLRPKTFEIDCLVENRDAIEVKWRDATTDGDHIIKEHNRLSVIAAAGYKPIRVMFYYPNRTQAIRIQKTLETLYHGANGDYYFGDSAWQFIKNYTGINLKEIFLEIAKEKMENVPA